ncbi:hypothetical protein FKG94_03115 [Exilibacterium tricleocarpae]|uniref:Uncharacterized protein n=1 Tax=Exilibacterium tricleocarpae TaxID=2591008 RepID=A0A545U6X6_9GAMM|nr:hypothetical protein [Exilibacterium tricleocarpae]TQV85194.1 hypothetical protein FKG94_03115 [Exilibacterium tricleocarpae]
MTHSARLSVSLTVEQTAALDFSAPKDSLSYAKAIQLLEGTGANQANKTYHDQRTLAASANEELDLSGALTDAFGSAIAFTKIKSVVMFAAESNGDVIEVGGAAANGFADWVGAAAHVVRLRPGGLFVLSAPDDAAYTVTAGTGDLLRITNTDAAGAASYDIILTGVV